VDKYRNVYPFIYDEHIYFDETLLRVICAVGLLGNLLTGIVLTRPSMRSAIGWLLFGLAVFDSIFLLSKLHVPGIPSYYLMIEVDKWVRYREYRSYPAIWLFTVNGFLSVLGKSRGAHIFILLYLAFSVLSCCIAGFLRNLQVRRVPSSSQLQLARIASLPYDGPSKQKASAPIEPQPSSLPL
jgi:hypothetical protein